MNALSPAFRRGTHRLVPPEETLARLAPHLLDFGITRCAEVTGLDDDLGVPVYVAIRPRGRGEAFVLLGFRIPGSVGLDDVGTTAVPGIVLRYKG